jgi:CRP-like cAMP-binding protein
MDFKRGEVLFQEGDRSRFVYRVVSGEVEITSHRGDRAEVIGRVPPGNYVGEMGVLVAARRAGTARFCEDSAVAALTRREFLAEIARDRLKSLRLLNVLSLRTRALVNRLENRSPVNRGWLQLGTHWVRRHLKPIRLDKPTRARLTRPGVPQRALARGDVLFSEGDPGNHVFWVESGRIRVDRLGTVQAGEFIGEMGVLESMPRTAGATAASATVVRCLTPEFFFRLMESSPRAFVAVVESLCQRAHSLHESSAGGAGGDGLFSAVQSIESVTQLAEQRLVDEASRMKRFLEVQADRGRFVTMAYRNYLQGQSNREEMEKANAYFRDYLKMAGVGALIVLPGTPLTIPLAAKIGKALGVNIFPDMGEEEEPDAEKKAAVGAG